MLACSSSLFLNLENYKFVTVSSVFFLYIFYYVKNSDVTIAFWDSRGDDVGTEIGPQ